MHWAEFNSTQNCFFFFFFLVPPLNFLYSPAEQDTVAEITVFRGKVLEETKDEESSYLELILENDSFNSV